MTCFACELPLPPYGVLPPEGVLPFGELNAGKLLCDPCAEFRSEIELPRAERIALAESREKVQRRREDWEEEE